MTTPYVHEEPPETVDWLVVHKFDPVQPAPGGVDTVVRGILRYAPEGLTLAVVGVAGTADGRDRLGRWERHDLRGRAVHFLPVTALDPGRQLRRVPHAVRVSAGAWRHRGRLPRARGVQVHRSDVAVATAGLTPGARRALFIHTQQAGITGATSDSFWRRARRVQGAVEARACRTADDIRVFNEDYATTLRERFPQTRFSPTWYDPELIRPRTRTGGHDVVWVGRVERPKNAALAVAAFECAVRRDPTAPWTLTVVGDGTFAGRLREQVDALAPDIRTRITLAGRLDQAGVMSTLAASSVFLMTSEPGYEGYPMSLVEALASGLPAVVTTGADTGKLVRTGHNGVVEGYDAARLGDALIAARELPGEDAAASVTQLQAPVVVDRLLRP